MGHFYQFDLFFGYWLVAMLVTLVIGFPVGLGVSKILRRFNRETLVAYLATASGTAVVIAMFLGDPIMGVGFVTTAVTLAFGYWFFVAKPHIDNEGA